MSRKRERRLRYLDGRYTGVLYLMAKVDGWCMVRHAYAAPFTITIKEWEAMSPWSVEGELAGSESLRALTCR